MNMEVIRDFHPVGQGAFYTEVFLGDDGSRFVVVYDCGTETADDAMDIKLDDQIKRFAKSLSPYNTIDILFLSHFHADHISGIKALLSTFKVKKTVIPMLDVPTLTVTRVQNFMRFSAAMAESADQIIQELYFTDRKSEHFGEITVVAPEIEGEQTDEDGGAFILNGTKVLSGSKLFYKDIWEYIPFNSIEKNDPRAIALRNGLVDLSNNLGLAVFDLYALLRDHLDEVRDEYKAAMKNANDNLYSLVVVSQPVAGVVPQLCPRLAHGIYFGDFDCYQKNKPWDRLNKVIQFSELGTVQVPHHGARGNWHGEMGKGDPRHYIVSSGSTNCHHHPNFWVLQEIWEDGHRIFVVSEKWNSETIYCFDI